jgi:hypothetical protein
VDIESKAIKFNFEKEDTMKKIIGLVAAICFALVGFSEKVMAGPAPLSVQEAVQLNQLAGNDALLGLKAGGSFPNAPSGLEATEESSLKNLEKGSPKLSSLKAGDDGAGTVLVWVVVICVCIVLLRVVGV